MTPSSKTPKTLTDSQDPDFRRRRLRRRFFAPVAGRHESHQQVSFGAPPRVGYRQAISDADMSTMTETPPRTIAPMRLYSGPLSMFGMKAEIALREKGLPFDLVMVPFDMAKLYEPKHPDVARINPKRQVPVLIHRDLEIFDSTQIFEYLEDVAPAPPLWPKEPAARARARQLEHLSDEIYFPPIIRLMGLQKTPDDPAAITAREIAARFCDDMERRIGDRDWLCGDYTYADIAFYMAQLFGARMGAPMTDAHPRLRAWRLRMTTRPAVQEAMRPLAAFLTSHNRPLPDFMRAFAP